MGSETVREGGGDAAPAAGGRETSPETQGPGIAATPPETPAARAVAWAVSHLSEREAVFSRTGLLASALAWSPGAASAADIEREMAALEKTGTLHAARLPGLEGALTTDRAAADEKETIALMESGRSPVAMRPRAVDKALRNGPLTEGQKGAVKLILSAGDRTVGVQGFAGTGKTTMLRRARALLEKKGYEAKGLAPSASAARTLEAEAGIGSETLQRFLARYKGVSEGRMTARGAKDMRAAFRKTALVVDEGSLASTVQARDLLRIAHGLRIPRVVLVGDAKQLDAVDAGKPFAQLQAAGMKTAVMDEIMRQRDPALKEAVEASLAGDIGKAFDKLGGRIAEAKADNLAGAAAARWLALPAEQRANAGLMAPSHSLRGRINEIVRERLVRDGEVRGPALAGERLVSRGYTSAEKTLSANYAPGRRGGLPPPLQAARGRQGRRAPRPRRRPQDARGDAGGPGRAKHRLASRTARRPHGRGGGLQERGHRAPRWRPRPVDPQRRRPRAGQLRNRRGRGGLRRQGDVPPRGRAHAGAVCR